MGSAALQKLGTAFVYSKTLRSSSCYLSLLILREEFSNMSSGDTHLDAEWKRIQKKTFTRWCNEHLKVQDMFLEDLTTDLSDGVRLIVLIEVLSHKKVGRYNKKPRVYAQKMENVQLALDFLMKKERIRLVNIGAWARSHRCQLALGWAALL